MSTKKIAFPGSGVSYELAHSSLNFMQNAFIELSEALGTALGNKVILSGVVVSGGAVTDGWIIYDGEILEFRGGTYDDNVQIYEVDGAVSTEKIRYAQCVVGTGGFDFSELKRHRREGEAIYRNSAGAESTKYYKTKIVESGAWDMDADVSVSVAHGIDDHEKIVQVTAVIWDDVATSCRCITSQTVTEDLGGTVSFDATDITLLRVTGGLFDSPIFSTTPTINGVVTRAFITIKYEE